jgi:CheY-like chemotaxis protein
VPLVLAIEPDLRQAAIVKRIVREKALADVTVVDSRETAIEAIRHAMPDVLLISALLSPRDEHELIAHLRTLDDGGHLQTHTIPQLASALGGGEERASGGLLSAFRRKKKKEPEASPSGCDPDMFAEEIRSYLQRAAEMRRERIDGQVKQGSQDHVWRAAQPQKAAAFVVDPEPEESAPSSSSSWASPFEWKPSSAAAANPSSPIADPESRIAHSESPIAHPEPLIANPESPITQPESVVAYAGEPPSLMDHLRPRSGVTTLAALSVSAPVEEPFQLAAPIDVTPPEPARMVEPVAIEEVPIVLEAAPVLPAAPIEEAAPIQIAAPIEMPAPVVEAAPILETAPVLEAAAPVEDAPPVQAAPPSPDAGLSVKDSGSKDSGLGIRDRRLAMRDSKLGALASWVRSERPGRDANEKTDDLYGVLMGLAVPPAVVAVGYGRGCRIRRVRVPAAPDYPMSDSPGPVILSKRALAEQREQRT